MQVQSRALWGIRVATSEIQKVTTLSTGTTEPSLLLKIQEIYAEVQKNSFTTQSKREDELRVIEVGEVSWVVGRQLPNENVFDGLPVQGVLYPSELKLASTPPGLWGIDRIFSRRKTTKQVFPGGIINPGKGVSAWTLFFTCIFAFLFFISWCANLPCVL
jgi:hypothetical protein